MDSVVGRIITPDLFIYSFDWSLRGTQEQFTYTTAPSILTIQRLLADFATKSQHELNLNSQRLPWGEASGSLRRAGTLATLDRRYRNHYITVIYQKITCIQHRSDPEVLQACVFMSYSMKEKKNISPRRKIKKHDTWPRSRNETTELKSNFDFAVEQS